MIQRHKDRLGSTALLAFGSNVVDWSARINAGEHVTNSPVIHQSAYQRKVLPRRILRGFLPQAP